MAQRLWSEVDRYVGDLLVGQDAVLGAALAASVAAGLPEINVSTAQGKFLHLLARAMRARRILEIGTLGGYSTIWLGRALGARGKLITLEIDPRHAEVARGNILRAGLAKRVEVRVGKALELLPKIKKEGVGPFDFIFIDADKPRVPEYFAWALKLARVGSVIVVDNVVREGAVANVRSRDKSVRGVRRMNERVAAEKRVAATVIQTVGSKGYDGFLLAVVLS